MATPVQTAGLAALLDPVLAPPGDGLVHPGSLQHSCALHRAGILAGQKGCARSDEPAMVQPIYGNHTSWPASGMACNAGTLKYLSTHQPRAICGLLPGLLRDVGIDAMAVEHLLDQLWRQQSTSEQTIQEDRGISQRAHQKTVVLPSPGGSHWRCTSQRLQGLPAFLQSRPP